MFFLHVVPFLGLFGCLGCLCFAVAPGWFSNLEWFCASALMFPYQKKVIAFSFSNICFSVKTGGKTWVKIGDPLIE